MKYITIKRYKRNKLNIPYGTEVEEIDGTLYYNNQRICGDHSAVMREYFARNDDGLGLKRGKVAHAIIDAMLMREGESKEDWQKRWDILWNDPCCNKYRKDFSESTFLWGIEFFNATLIDLYHIAALAGAKIKE